MTELFEYDYIRFQWLDLVFTLNQTVSRRISTDQLEADESKLANKRMMVVEISVDNERDLAIVK